MSSPVTAHKLKPSASSPRRPAAAANASPATATAVASGNHSGSTFTVCSARDRTPSRLWLSGFSTGLTRPGSANSPAQYHAELAGITANPAATVAANTAAAVAAAR